MTAEGMPELPNGVLARVTPERIPKCRLESSQWTQSSDAAVIPRDSVR